MTTSYQLQADNAMYERIVMEVLRQLGLDSCERSYSECCRTYGKWFIDAAASGTLQPCRFGVGSHPTRYYSVREILNLKRRDSELAEIQK